MLYSLRKFDTSEIAKKRLDMIKFYERYGEQTAKEAFGADRKVISRWRQKLKQERGRLTALTPSSTRPHHLRRSHVPHEIVVFIKALREKHPRLGKEKIKIFLDPYCGKQKLKPISVSTIGNVIKRHHFFFQASGKVYHNPDSKWAQASRKKPKRLRVRHPPRPADFGHILSDTVERFTDGVKDYFLSAIDAKSKFVLTLNYKRLTSRNMKDFYQRFKTVCPVSIKTWQSDNGSENLGEFDEQLKLDQIPHFFSYPRCPKINTYIERYNRTLQEEFIDNHLDIIHDKPLFSKALADYLVFYNAQRPHHSLALKAPLQYMISNNEMSQMCVTYTPP